MDGSVRTWSGVLPADLTPGGSLLLDLTMTTLADDPVVIGYEVSVGEPSLIFRSDLESGSLDEWSSSRP
ncbi:MAG: hypothetical protein AAF725_20425 [Acidobacteriota bacterium]